MKIMEKYMGRGMGFGFKELKRYVRGGVGKVLKLREK